MRGQDQVSFTHIKNLTVMRRSKRMNYVVQITSSNQISCTQKNNLFYSLQNNPKIELS
jgi:hypothetical protein